MQNLRITTYRSRQCSATNCRKSSYDGLKEDIKKAGACLQLCAGQETGCEAGIHIMPRIFESNKAETILMVDEESAFNSINRKALLHNIECLHPEITASLCNYYTITARLYYWRKIIKMAWRNNKRESKSDGRVYLRFNTITQLSLIRQRSVKHVSFADDLTDAGKLDEIKIWWDNLMTDGPKHGYYPKPSKSFLIVKQYYKEYGERIFAGSNINITTEGARNFFHVFIFKNQNFVKTCF